MNKKFNNVEKVYNPFNLQEYSGPTGLVQIKHYRFKAGVKYQYQVLFYGKEVWENAGAPIIVPADIAYGLTVEWDKYAARVVIVA